jgi:hypothetical protein
MPKKANVKKQLYLNVLLISLIVLTACCYIFCGNEEDTSHSHEHQNRVRAVRENLTEMEEKNNKNNKSNKSNKSENFLDWSMYNPPIVNGYTPDWWNRVRNGYMGNPKIKLNPNNMYNPLGYSNRSQAFYEQGSYPNMAMPPQVIGCGGRRMPCLGGTQETIPVINAPIEISERNIAPVNILSRSIDPDAIGVLRQVGVLYKVFGSLNEIFPLYGVKRYRNSDTWDYSTKVGKQGNFVHVKVLTKRVNNNELQTNDVVMIDGNSSKFRVTVYENNEFPQYVPYFKG